MQQCMSGKNKIYTEGTINMLGYWSNVLVHFSKSKQMELTTGSKIWRIRSQMWAMDVQWYLNTLSLQPGQREKTQADACLKEGRE